MKKIKYPDGYVGVCSDKVAKILSKREGHEIIEDEDKPKVGRPAKKEEEKE